MPAALNAADEVAVGAFLEGRIPFTAIAEVVEDVLTAHRNVEPTSVSDVEHADAEARAHAVAAVDQYLL